MERNTFSASATSCKTITSTYAKVAVRVSTSLHALNLSNSFLHFDPLPLGVAERSNLMAHRNTIQQWEESREEKRGKIVGRRDEGGVRSPVVLEIW